MIKKFIYALSIITMMAVSPVFAQVNYPIVPGTIVDIPKSESIEFKQDGYVTVNTRTGVYHKIWWESVVGMKKENAQFYKGDLRELDKAGYHWCKKNNCR